MFYMFQACIKIGFWIMLLMLFWNVLCLLLEDGLKPVQRRILHSLKELEDGRFHKVANVIGHTMKYHPHGDASIADAMVQIGQKDLLLDLQGNLGEYTNWR